MSCGECKFRDLLNCRRFPPSIVPVVFTRRVDHDDPGDVETEITQALPLVKPDDWCGEFRSKSAP